MFARRISLLEVPMSSRYLQASGFPSQSPEYAFECCRKQLERYGISLSYSSLDVDLVVFFV